MGIFGDMAKMAGALLAIFQTRAELFTVELQEEAQRLLACLILSLAALFCAAMAALLVVLLVVALFWETHRILIIGVLIVLFGGAALLIGLGLRGYFRRKPQFLAYTRSEIARDLERFKSGNNPKGGQA
ncbi:MAG: phage holin family protein [Burkholderiaceae bacterium]|jgi:uncharacterized membrane protein YqjE|nr:phage holin family protein [Burkholderiaceae bacterium]